MANVDPFRLRVMKALCDALKTISPDNGYITNFSDGVDSEGRKQERVFRGREYFGDNDPLPMLCVLEDPAPLESNNDKANTGNGYNRFRVLIQGFVEDDKDNPLDPAYLASAEVIKAIVKTKMDRYNILDMGNRTPCVGSLSIGQPVHRPADNDVSSVAFFMVGVTLTLAEDLEKPFD